MAEFNHARKEITFKLVYYGPALSGKTTNLQMIHQGADKGSTGELMTLATEGDRTLFFDMLPVRMKTTGGFSIRLKLFTVPGQVQHNSTRKIVLRGCDGIVFVADSSAAVSKQNAESFDNLRKNMKEIGRTLAETPLVVQFNKRDLPDAVPEEMIQKSWGASGIPTTLAVAMKGEGVTETFEALAEQLYDSLDKKYEFAKKFKLTREDFLVAMHSNFAPAANAGSGEA